jgi:IMP dehydrogenase
MSSIEIGRGKRARTAYSFDDIAVAPSRRTRNPDEVSTEWRIDAYRFDTPIIAAPMDSVVSPESAHELGRNGVLAVLNLEGLWTRYADPEPILDRIRTVADHDAVGLLQEVYSQAPVDPDLIAKRVGELREGGSTVAVAVSPQHAATLAPHAVAAGVEMLVIRGTTVSAEHVSQHGDPLNLKTFIYELDVPVIVGGCSTYQAALHLMRTGAAGVLVGFGGGAAHTTADVLGIRVPMATAVAEVAEARRDYLDESQGRYVHVIADGSVGSSGALVKALACGADAVMIGSVFARATDSPGQGVHWGAEAWHASLPRGERKNLGTVGTLEQILHGPSHTADGSANIIGALRKAMATTGYSDLKEFQRIEVITSPDT